MFCFRYQLLIACILIMLVFVYNRYSKQYDVLGPLTMGLCRGVNLLLGLSIVPDKLVEFWWLAGLGFIYIFTVTVMSKGEVGSGLYPIRVRIMAGAVLTCYCYFAFAFLWCMGNNCYYGNSFYYGLFRDFTSISKSNII